MNAAERERLDIAEAVALANVKIARAKEARELGRKLREGKPVSFPTNARVGVTT